MFAGEAIPDPVIDSGISLGDEHSDDDFVLGGPGSDITISPGDRGIFQKPIGASGYRVNVGKFRIGFKGVLTEFDGLVVSLGR